MRGRRPCCSSKSMRSQLRNQSASRDRPGLTCPAPDCSHLREISIQRLHHHTLVNRASLTWPVGPPPVRTVCSAETTNACEDTTGRTDAGRPPNITAGPYQEELACPRHRRWACSHVGMDRGSWLVSAARRPSDLVSRYRARASRPVDLTTVSKRPSFQKRTLAEPSSRHLVGSFPPGDKGFRQPLCTLGDH
jgi:hypothetical protein